MGELQNGIEEYMVSPEQEGSEQEKLDQYSADVRKIVHESPEWQVEKDQLEKSNEKHVSQQELEETTKRGFEVIREWVQRMKDLKVTLQQSEKEHDHTLYETTEDRKSACASIHELEKQSFKAFFGEFEKYGIKNWTVLSNPEFAYAFLLISKLFNQGGPGEHQFLLDKGVNVLEVAGRSGVKEQWPSMGGLIETGANYLGTDYGFNPKSWDRYKKHGKQEVNFVEADALKLSRELKEKQFEVLYCMSFLGAPSHLASKSVNMDNQEYDTEILNQFDSQLRDGGVLILGTRENPSINVVEKLEEMGYEVTDFQPEIMRYIIARKRVKS